MHASPKCLKALLEWGGDLCQQDKDGRSPLDYATDSSPLTLITQQYGKVCRPNDISIIHALLFSQLMEVICSR